MDKMVIYMQPEDAVIRQVQTGMAPLLNPNDKIKVKLNSINFCNINKHVF